MLRAVFFAEPAEPIKLQLNKIINDLSSQYNTALFEAHITFYTDFYTNEQSIMDVFNAVIKDAPGFSLQPTQISYSDIFTRSLFLEFEDDSGLKILYEKAKNLTSSSTPYVYRPHISLMYTSMPIDDRQMLVQDLKLPRGKFLFDCCGVAVTVEKPSNKADIEQWRLLNMKTLAL